MTLILSICDISIFWGRCMENQTNQELKWQHVSKEDWIGWGMWLEWIKRGWRRKCFENKPECKTAQTEIAGRYREWSRRAESVIWKQKTSNREGRVSLIKKGL
jgi:hypothetical protein